MHPAWTDATARAALRILFDTAVAAADPRAVLARHLPPKPRSGRCIVVGGGKSAAVMAAALEDAWPDVSLEGTVVTRYGHAVPTRHIEVIEASHPVPDASSERGAQRLCGVNRFGFGGLEFGECLEGLSAFRFGSLPGFFGGPGFVALFRNLALHPCRCLVGFV